MTRRRCDFFFDFRITLFESSYGSRMRFRMGVAWDFTEQEEADHAGQVLQRRAHKLKSKKSSTHFTQQ